MRIRAMELLVPIFGFILAIMIYGYVADPNKDIVNGKSKEAIFHFLNVTLWLFVAMYLN